MGYNALQEYEWALRSDKSRHSLDSMNRKCSYFRSYIKKFKFKGKKWEQSCAILLEQGKTPKMIVPILLKMGEHGNISGSHPPLRGDSFTPFLQLRTFMLHILGCFPCMLFQQDPNQGTWAAFLPSWITSLHPGAVLQKFLCIFFSV